VETVALPCCAAAPENRGIFRGGTASIFSAAGVVTKRVTEAAERAGFVFAVDPTSRMPPASAATSP
jgi:hypothetical protein